MGNLLLELQRAHFLIVLKLNLVVTFLEVILLMHQIFLRFLLIVLQHQSVRLVLQGRLLLLRRSLQHEHLLIVLLRQQHFLLFDLLVDLQTILPFLLVTHCIEVVRLLLELRIQNTSALNKLLIEVPGIRSLLPVDRRWIWNSFREPLWQIWLHWVSELGTRARDASNMMHGH